MLKTPVLISSIVGVVVPEKIVNPASREDAGGEMRGAGSDVEVGGPPLTLVDIKLVKKSYEEDCVDDEF